MKRRKIFEETLVPPWHRRNALGRTTPWFTWSTAFRQFAWGLEHAGVLRRRATLKWIRGCEPSAATYSLPLDWLEDKLRRELLAFTADLPGSSDREDLRLFRDMLVPPFDQGQMRAVFSLFRTALVMIAEDERAALYSPVAPKSTDTGFKLHADLFLTTKVWLIFDDIPDDGSGASLFVTRRDLLQTVRSLQSIPAMTAAKIATLMTQRLKRDSFERLYWLIHSEQNRWHEPLMNALDEKVKSIALRRGEGYLMNDRRWLHGRTAASGAVTAKRFHRLSYELARSRRA
jgi:hypothetical protein